MPDFMADRVLALRFIGIRKIKLIQFGGTRNNEAVGNNRLIDTSPFRVSIVAVANFELSCLLTTAFVNADL